MATRKLGRPSEYSQQAADELCEYLAQGKSLISYCKLPSTPGFTTVMRWLAEREEFRDQYARAREAQADYYAEEVVEIASTVLPAIKRTESRSGKRKHVEEVHGDAVERSRLMMDARKWYAGKLAPKKYGEKLDVTQRVMLTKANLTDADLETIAAGGSAGAAGPKAGEGEP